MSLCLCVVRTGSSESIMRPLLYRYHSHIYCIKHELIFKGLVIFIFIVHFSTMEINNWFNLHDKRIQPTHQLIHIVNQCCTMFASSKVSKSILLWKAANHKSCLWDHLRLLQTILTVVKSFDLRYFNMKPDEKQPIDKL